MSEPQALKITYLVWLKFYNNDGERAFTIRQPSWAKVLEVFNRLNGQEYPSFYLYFHQDIKHYPQLFVVGGSEEYGLTFYLADEDGNRANTRISYLNQQKAHSSDANELREIGKGYHNYEIEEKFLTSSRSVIIALIEHILSKSQWPANVPSLVQYG